MRGICGLQIQFQPILNLEIEFVSRKYLAYTTDFVKPLQIIISNVDTISKYLKKYKILQVFKYFNEKTDDTPPPCVCFVYYPAKRIDSTAYNMDCLQKKKDDTYMEVFSQKWFRHLLTYLETWVKQCDLYVDDNSDLPSKVSKEDSRGEEAEMITREFLMNGVKKMNTIQVPAPTWLKNLLKTTKSSCLLDTVYTSPAVQITDSRSCKRLETELDSHDILITLFRQGWFLKLFELLESHVNLRRNIRRTGYEVKDFMIDYYLSRKAGLLDWQLKIPMPPSLKPILGPVEQKHTFTMSPRLQDPDEISSAESEFVKMMKEEKNFQNNFLVKKQEELHCIAAAWLKRSWVLNWCLECQGQLAKLLMNRLLRELGLDPLDFGKLMTEKGMMKNAENLQEYENLFNDLLEDLHQFDDNAEKYYNEERNNGLSSTSRPRSKFLDEFESIWCKQFERNGSGIQIFATENKLDGEQYHVLQILLPEKKEDRVCFLRIVKLLSWLVLRRDVDMIYLFSRHAKYCNSWIECTPAGDHQDVRKNFRVFPRATGEPIPRANEEICSVPNYSSELHEMEFCRRSDILDCNAKHLMARRFSCELPELLWKSFESMTSPSRLFLTSDRLRDYFAAKNWLVEPSSNSHSHSNNSAENDNSAENETVTSEVPKVYLYIQLKTGWLEILLLCDYFTFMPDTERLIKYMLRKDTWLDKKKLDVSTESVTDETFDYMANGIFEKYVKQNPSYFIAKQLGRFEPGFLPQANLAGFIFDSRLGKGANGEVWHVRRSLDNYSTALKLIDAGKFDETSLREVAALAALHHHDNIVQYYRSWREELSETRQNELNKLGTGNEKPSCPAFQGHAR